MLEMSYHFKMNKLIFKLFYGNMVILAFALLVSGCAPKIPSEINENIEVYFCPRQDCGKFLEEKIRSADNSIHCALYDINLRNVIDALSDKSKHADVKVVIDADNNKSQIKGDGLRLDHNNALMHNKFCVIDNEIVTTGSLNPTENDNFKNRNNFVVVHSEFLAKNFEDEFLELWNKNSANKKARHPSVVINGILIENYFCPEDNCALHVIDSIKNARQSVHFLSFSFTNGDIADALIRKNGQIEIKGVVDSSQSSNKYSQHERMQDFGIEVKKDNEKYKMHSKIFIIDNSTVITGSFNPTQSGDERNDENIIIIHDKEIAKLFLKEFDEIWGKQE